MKNVAIVTGASSGLGREFARLVAGRRGVDEVWIVARRGERLEELAGGIAAEATTGGGASAPLVPIVADLSRVEGAAAIQSRLEAERPTVRLLVANAGLGRYGSFADLSKAEALEMVDLNVRSLTATTKDVLPYMARGSGLILVSSLAGFGPNGDLAVYAATKAYVLSLGLALGEELADAGIAVTTLCPGPFASEFANVASKGRLGPRRTSKSPRSVADRCLRDFDGGRRLSFGHWSWRLGSLAVRLFTKRAFARFTRRFVSR